MIVDLLVYQVQLLDMIELDAEKYGHKHAKAGNHEAPRLLVTELALVHAAAHLSE